MKSTNYYARLRCDNLIIMLIKKRVLLNPGHNSHTAAFMIFLLQRTKTLFYGNKTRKLFHALLSRPLPFSHSIAVWRYLFFMLLFSFGYLFVFFQCNNIFVYCCPTFHKTAIRINARLIEYGELIKSCSFTSIVNNQIEIVFDIVIISQVPNSN